MSILMESLVNYASLSTIVLCLILKVPQIKSLYAAKNTVGLSLTSILLELTGYSIVFCYNASNSYALLAYLEYPFLIIQDVLLLGLYFLYNGSLGFLVLSLLGVYVSVVYSLATDRALHYVISTLIALVTPIAAASKLAQIRVIWTSRNSDTVSVLTWSIAAYTCIARLLTTAVETRDIALMITYTVSLVLNLAIIVSALHFRRFSKAKAGLKAE